MEMTRICVNDTPVQKLTDESDGINYLKVIPFIDAKRRENKGLILILKKKEQLHGTFCTDVKPN